MSRKQRNKNFNESEDYKTREKNRVDNKGFVIDQKVLLSNDYYRHTNKQNDYKVYKVINITSYHNRSSIVTLVNCSDNSDVLNCDIDWLKRE